ncbi:alpha/beta fold hydrolase [Cellulomonas humilata]|uniref:Alpha/beta fold hydrolase n=1 Tax=Cellulomonas humilata TaxID=144055 RepID=A0A7Y6DZJ1_9CELL|nr:alpha/beta hydrolase [Cellulomonas humilata]NUU19778.1 alpha/beta fold hydrolase [Cellulomonas humilata]
MADPETLRYGTLPEQVVDLTFPTGAARPPLVVLLHGGFWRVAYDRLHLRVVADDLTARGYAVANVEYRRVGGGGGWPATFTDVAAAVDAVEAELVDRVDLDSVAYVGHSAGGHLALWAALRDRLPTDAPGRAARPPRVRGVVALAPAADLAAVDRLGLGRGAVAELLGGTPATVPARFAATDPGTLGAPAAATVVVHGLLDDTVPVSVAHGYRDRTGVRVVEVPDAGHFELIDPASGAWPVVLESLRDVLR